MKLKTIAVVAMMTVSAAYTPAALAQVSEVRVGLSEFDERTLNVGLSTRRASENSAALNFEVLFDEPDFLKWALTPQPYIGGALNLDGKTSYGGAGLLWRQSFGDKFYGDFSFGLVAHTGTNEIPRLDPPSTFASLMTLDGRLRADAYLQRLRSEIQFGSTLLFREQIALGYNVNEHWSGELFFEHISNGQVFSSSRNNGADIIGFRAARKF